MKLYNNMDVQPKTYGSYEKLPAGGHICTILSARSEERKGVEYIVLSIDIREGSKYDGFYKAMYERICAKQSMYADKAPTWPCEFWSSPEDRDNPGSLSPYFKGLITAIEQSNPGFTFDWNHPDERSLRGKRVGFVFGEEEYIHPATNEVRTSIKPRWHVSADKALDEPAPEIKKLKPGQQPRNIGGVNYRPVLEDKLPWE